MKGFIIIIVLILGLLPSCMKAVIKAPITLSSGQITTVSVELSRPIFANANLAVNPVTGLITISADTSQGFTQAFTNLTSLAGLLGQMYLKPGATPTTGGTP